MRIPDEKLEEVRDATDIVDVVSDYVSLKRRGARYVGLCPFHNEKTPSFYVTPDLGFYKCFGCGRGGDVFSFLREIEHVGFVESIRMLAERASIPLPEEQSSDVEQSNEIESIYHSLRFAARFYYDRLTQTDAGRKVGLAYLTERGYTPETIKKFGLGYAPSDWDALMRHAQENHVGIEYLEKAGLVIRRSNEGASEDRLYDRYRDRVIFPLFSHVGKVLGFAGRIVKSDPSAAKYINSPETQVYHKSKVLYGLYQGKDEIRRREKAMLVEGYTDVITLHQADIRNVVASSGTALTSDQVQLLGRYVNTIYLLYDADQAGINAALRGIDLILAEDLEVYIVALPDGADPDSFVKQFGGEAFRNFVEKHREDFIEFKLSVAARRKQLGTPDAELRVIQDILSSIARIPNPIKQEAYIRQASARLGIPDMQLRPEMQKVLRNQRHQDQRKARREMRRSRQVEAGSPPDHFAEWDAASATGGPYADAVDAPKLPRPVQEPLPEEEKLIQLMLVHGDFLVELILGHMALEEFTEGVSRDTVATLLEMYQADGVRRESFLDGSRGPALQQFVAGILMENHEASNHWVHVLKREIQRDPDPERSAVSAMRLLKLDRVDQAIKDVRRRVFRAQQAQADVMPLLAEIESLKSLRQQIDAAEFMNW